MADGSDFNDRLKGVDRLKRNKPEERAERERLRKELEEDKARRAEIFGAQKAEREEKAAAAAAASAAYRDTSTSQLSIRTESGALRHTFPAETTLAEVRTWVLEEGRRVAVEAQRAAANAAAVDSDGIGAGRTLGAIGEPGFTDFTMTTRPSPPLARSSPSGPGGAVTVKQPSASATISGAAGLRKTSSRSSPLASPRTRMTVF